MLDESSRGSYSTRSISGIDSSWNSIIAPTSSPSAPRWCCGAHEPSCLIMPSVPPVYTKSTRPSAFSWLTMRLGSCLCAGSGALTSSSSLSAAPPASIPFCSLIIRSGVALTCGEPQGLCAGVALHRPAAQS
eukprot:scaffold39474_cov33-Tisochrysis_lutea.AAC.5